MSKASDTIINTCNDIIKIGETEGIEVVTSQFVRLDEQFVPYDTGTSERNIKDETNYKKGEVIYNVPYAYDVYYDGSEGGQDQNFIKPTAEKHWFDVTWENEQDYLSKVLINTINKNL